MSKDNFDIDQLKVSMKKGTDSLKDIYDSCSSYCMNALVRYHNCSKPDANDIFIDALLIFRDKVLRSELEYLTNLNHYLLGICINLNKKRLRTMSHENSADSMFTIDEFSVSSYEDQTVARELHQARESAVMTTFKQLSSSCQEILTLFYVDHTSMEDIALELSMASANVAKVTKMRCLKKWRELYKIQQHDGQS